MSKIPQEVDVSKKKSLSDFEEIGNIGKGSSATTKKYREKKTGDIYCVKFYYFYEKGSEDDVFKQTCFNRELFILNFLAKNQNPALLSLYGYRDELNNHFIITKYYPKDLKKHLESELPISLSSRYLIILGIAEGMKYLHSKEIIHRDLKPDNVLIEENEQGDLNPIICDFSHSRPIDKDMTYQNIMGTLKYIAPEAVVRNYTNKVDVFSFSILFYEILAWENPYQEDASSFPFYDKVRFNNHRPKLERLNINQKIKEFLEKCWDGDPDKRPTFTEIVDKLKSKEFRESFQADDQKVEEYLAKFDDSLTPKDPVLAKQLADEDDDEESIIKYARMLQTGKNVRKVDKKEALKYYKKASDMNNSYAMLQCALLLIEPNTSYQNRDEAKNYLKSAIALGNYDALQTYIKENFDQLSNKELENCYKVGASNGTPEALEKYGEILYQNGDKVNALDYFKKAAKKRCLPAISKAARMLDEGDGVEVNKSDAKLFFEIGIKLNDSNSMLFYALSLLNNPYADINIDQIVENFKNAANMMNSNAKLFYATILRNGYLNVGVNMKLARDNVNDAKNLMSIEEAKLAFNFGTKILNDKIKVFLKKDAEVFFECASKKGNVDAMISYADILWNNHRETEALKWLNRASTESEVAREKYCNLYGVFHKLFYNLEPKRTSFGVDVLKHVITVLTVAFTKDNKPKVMQDMKKKRADNIDAVLNEIKLAYEFVYNSDSNDVLIRKLLEQNLKDSDFL